MEKVRATTHKHAASTLREILRSVFSYLKNKCRRRATLTNPDKTMENLKIHMLPLMRINQLECTLPPS